MKQSSRKKGGSGSDLSSKMLRSTYAGGSTEDHDAAQRPKDEQDRTKDVAGYRARSKTVIGALVAAGVDAASWQKNLVVIHGLSGTLFHHL